MTVLRLKNCWEEISKKIQKGCRGTTKRIKSCPRLSRAVTEDPWLLEFVNYQHKTKFM